MSLTQYFKQKEKVGMPKCDYDQTLDAQYDFVDKDGNWRYGCTKHWMEHRATKEIGPGHARHLHAGQTPPKRPEGYVAPPLPAGSLVRPRVAQNVQGYVEHQPTPGVAAEARAPKAPREPREKRAKVTEFQDMVPNVEMLQSVKEPRPGSVLAITLDLIRDNNGATLEEIQQAIDPDGKKHNALKLLQWANENKGYGFRKDEAGKIHTVYHA